jgi:hypothetical protein
MSMSVVVLIARIGLVLLLYLFLYLVVRAMRRDLRSAGRSAPAAARAPAAAGMPHLLVLAEGHTTYKVGQQFILRNPMLVGRDPSCDIPIEDEFVSGLHLKLRLGANGWQAQDLNSRNGTRLNGIALRGTKPLNSGDVLDMGRVRLRFMSDQ